MAVVDSAITGDWTGNASAILNAITGALGLADEGTGTATLTWIAPERDGDNAALSDLSGYYIYKSTDSEAGTFGTYTLVTDITNETTLTYTVTGLTAGTWYFWMTAYDSAGDEGNNVYLGSKTI